MRMHKKYFLVITAVVLFLLAVAGSLYFGGFSFTKFSFSGQVIAPIHNNYTWTKAVCNSMGCIDIIIECQDGKVKSMKPASDFVRMGDFVDERNNSDVLCE